MKILAITLAYKSQFSPILDLLKLNNEITLLAPRGTGNVSGFRALPLEFITHSEGSAFDRTVANFFHMARAVVEALQPVRNEQFDLVFGQASWGCTALVRAVLKCALISHIELPGLQMQMSRSDFPPSEEVRTKHTIQSALVYTSLRTSDLIITPSQYSKSLLPEDIQTRVRVSMEGFPLAPFRDSRQRAAIRRRNNLPVGVPILGYFGRTLEAVRGFDVYVQTACKVQQELPDTRFLVVGDPRTYYGNEGELLGYESFKTFALRQASMSESNFLFRPLQPVSVFRELIAAVDVAMFPIFENSGNWSFFECLAVGTPVVAGRRCFFPEVIHDGNNGYLCSVRDASEFASQCITLLKEPALRERIGRNGWETVRLHYTIAKATERYFAIFKEAAELTRFSTP